MAGPDINDVEVTNEERGVMRECVKEAFWYRSLPAAAITGDDKLKLQITFRDETLFSQD